MGTKMRKWCGGVFVSSLFTLLIFRYGLMKNPIGESYRMNLFLNVTNPLHSVNDNLAGAVTASGNSSRVISVDAFVSSLFSQRNFSAKEQTSLQTWSLLKHLVNNAHMLSSGLEAMKEAANAWNSLMASVEEERKGFTDKSSRKEKQCPHFLNNMNTTGHENSGYSLQFPCGLTQGSAITVIGIPNGILGNFQFDLKGESAPGEPDPPIIYHFNVRLHGDKITEDPVIVQNTWTVAHDWGEEERCPSPAPEKIKKVDELDQCNKMMGQNETRAASVHSDSRRSTMVSERPTTRSYFPFKQGYPFVATIRLGSEGIQMTVDEKHITSFAYRETLEPWLVNEIRISGDLHIISVLASGLPTTEDSEHAIDLKSLVSPPISSVKQTDLLIGVFSTANNFQRRMVIRRTWMQYAAVRGGTVSVRFFVGLHKSQIVNNELWDEARTYGDIQLMPFVDYYNLITWKTLAICIFGTEVASAKYIMKTDDDAFVRVDEVLTSVKRIKVNHSFLYGLINSDSRPHRSTDSKWYISPEEWPEDTYPPWAHGPGYVVSHDIAKRVYRRYKANRLKMFKLEDVAMGIWIADMKKEGLQINYEKESRIYVNGCKDDYVVAHYQGPREMLCLWQKLQQGTSSCCGD